MFGSSHSHVVIDYFFVGEMSDDGVAAGGRVLSQKGDYIGISNDLSTRDWNFEFVKFSMQDNFTLLCSVLMDLVERFVL